MKGINRKGNGNKGKRLAAAVLTAGLLAASLGGCGSSPVYKAPAKAEEAEIYVKAIDGIGDDFFRGMDASAVLSVENSGAKYYGFDGKEQDVFKTLAQAGVNYIRLRVWNDPYDADGNGYGGGNNDLDTAVTLGKRATKYGMKVCIDFHYSDFWADPKRQHAPKAWENMSLGEKSDALYAYTKESLTKLLDEGVDVGMVQVGNETNNGMSGETYQDALMQLLNAGSRAVREISESKKKDILVAVHFTNITKASGIDEIATGLEESGVDYDVFGLSYYPFWDGNLENMQKVVSNLKNDHGKMVMIAETSYPYTSADGDGFPNSVQGTDDILEEYPATVQGQTAAIRDVAAASYEAGASGIFYWEGTWIPVGPADADNSPLWEKYGSGWASSYSSEYDPEDAGLYYGGCSWDNQAMFDFDGHPLASLNVFKYLKYGTISEAETEVASWTAHSEAEDTGEELENFVKNPSFEDSDTSMWKVSYEGDNPTDFQENSADAHTGDFAFHFWSGSSDMDFAIEQEITGLEAGTYQLLAYAQGGDMSDDAELALYAVTADGEQSEQFHVTSWADWQNPTIPEIKITDGTVTVGVRMKCNKNSWGTVDDFALNRIGD